MRKFTFAALAACILLTGCGNNRASSASGSDSDTSVSQPDVSKTPAEKAEELLAAVDFPEMAEVTADKLLAYYGIDEADVTEYKAYVAGAGVYPDEFGIFVLSDKAAADKVHESLTNRLEKQQSTYADYSPDEMYKFDDAVLVSSDNVVYYCVCADNAAAEDILLG